MSTDARHNASLIGQKLIGGKITGAIIDDSGEDWEHGFGLRVEVGDKTYHCWVSQDAEANGPGWLHIEEA